MSSTTVSARSAADGKDEAIGTAEPPSVTGPRAVAPHNVPPHNVAPEDARRMTQLLLQRLEESQEGTAEYQYARNTLIELCLPLVHFVCRRFRQRDDQHEDIRQVGVIGLIKAIDRFDPQRGVEFTSFAIPYITGEIKRFFRDTTWAVHVPRRLQEQRIELARATDRLEARLGRSPRVSELAEEMRLSVDEAVEAQIAANGYSSHSLDLSAEEEADPKEGRTLLGRIGSCDPALEKVENLSALKPLLAELGERDRRILEMHFGEELTQQQIGDALGLSQMHISRLLRRCLDGLRTAMTEG